MTRDPWKLVTSVDELREGTALRWSDIGPEIAIILKICESDEPCDKGHDGPGFDLSDDPPDMAERNASNCLECDIERRVLYALIDDDNAADETTVTRRREMVE